MTVSYDSRMSYIGYIGYIGLNSVAHTSTRSPLAPLVIPLITLPFNSLSLSSYPSRSTVYIHTHNSTVTDKTHGNSEATVTAIHAVRR